MGPLRAPSGVDLDACYRYVCSRQTRSGGFCYYAHREWGLEEPNAPDTHAAVAICRRLRYPVPRVARCVAWLKEQQDETGAYASPVIAYATLEALRLMEVAPARDPRPYLRGLAAAWRTAAERGDLGGRFEAVRRSLQLWREHGLSLDDPLRAWLVTALAGLRVSGPASLIDAADATELAVAMECPPDPALLDYARRCEAPPHGFNLTPTTTASSLETQLAGLRLLSRFGERPRHPALLAAYVGGCQTASGGFGRAHGAIARLDDSRRAVEILALLSA